LVRQDERVSSATERRRVTPTLRVVPLVEHAGVRLIGDVDLSSWPLLEAAMCPFIAARGDVHLELAQLRFVDAHGASILARTAQQLGEGRRMVLHHPPRVLNRLLDLLWQDVPTIEVSKA